MTNSRESDRILIPPNFSLNFWKVLTQGVKDLKRVFSSIEGNKLLVTTCQDPVDQKMKSSSRFDFKIEHSHEESIEIIGLLVATPHDLIEALVGGHDNQWVVLLQDLLLALSVELYGFALKDEFYMIERFGLQVRFGFVTDQQGIPVVLVVEKVLVVRKPVGYEMPLQGIQKPGLTEGGLTRS